MSEEKKLPMSIPTIFFCKNCKVQYIQIFPNGMMEDLHYSEDMKGMSPAEIKIKSDEKKRCWNCNDLTITRSSYDR